MEEVVKYTLESHINETLEFDLSLSNSCFNLLKLEINMTTTNSFKGVPPYPLSKRLASTLLESINSKDICRSESGLKFFHEGSSLKQEENEWQKLVLDKESEIMNDVHWYASFTEMLGTESLAKVLPAVETIEEGIQIYKKFYTEEKEKTNGVLAIHVSKVDVQPYTCLAILLSVNA